MSFVFTMPYYVRIEMYFPSWSINMLRVSINSGLSKDRSGYVGKTTTYVRYLSINEYF